MGTPTNDFKIDSGYFHSVGKIQTLDTQYPFESNYKSGHNVLAKEIWSDTVKYAQTLDDAIEFCNSMHGSTIVKRYDKVLLKPVPGSNNQAYFLDNGYGHPITNWIGPQDVLDQFGNRSYGYQYFLHYGTDTIKNFCQGKIIPPTEGVFDIDVFSGLIRFQKGKTPIDLGWGCIMVSCFVYIGRTLQYLMDSNPLKISGTLTNDNFIDDVCDILHTLGNIKVMSYTFTTNNGVIDGPNESIMFSVLFYQNRIQLSLDGYQLKENEEISYAFFA